MSRQTEKAFKASVYHSENGRSLERPRRPDWITDDLLARVRAAWSEEFGREITNEESMEIIQNLRNFAEVLLYSRREERLP